MRFPKTAKKKIMTIDTTIGNYIFLGVGVVFGYVIHANIRAEKETQIYERLDKQMRQDLEYYKNLRSEEHTSELQSH